MICVIDYEWCFYCIYNDNALQGFTIVVHTPVPIIRHTLIKNVALFKYTGILITALDLTINDLPSVLILIIGVHILNDLQCCCYTLDSCLCKIYFNNSTTITRTRFQLLDDLFEFWETQQLNIELGYINNEWIWQKVLGDVIAAWLMVT